MQDTLQNGFSPFPVVAAPYGLVLGGGFEVISGTIKL